MLNPSTADAFTDDPTIRRCKGFALREGYKGIVVANIYAFRATHPADLQCADDKEGPDNSAALEQVARFHRRIVCAWGAHHIPASVLHARLTLLRSHGAELVCFGRTKDRHPRHPLYVPGYAAMEDFDGL
jgi:hypothetical protein